jgi:uncharacterized protein YlxW (UPF0749 family)
MSLVSVEGYSQFKKDTSSGGVVNVDKRSFETYKASKTRAILRNEEQRNTQNSVSQLQDEINTIRNDLDDIKCILMKLLDKGN